MYLIGLESNIKKLNWFEINWLLDKMIFNEINKFKVKSHKDLKLKLIFICSFEINLEKYIKIINNPLIMIKKIIIEYIKFNFQIEIFKHLKRLNIIINIIIIIGWSILLIIIKIIKNIKSHKIKKVNLINLIIVFSKNSLLRILILEIKGVNNLLFFWDFNNKKNYIYNLQDYSFC